MMRITRRSGLLGGLLLALSRRRAAADDAGLGSLFTQAGSARTIGAAYLRAYPDAALTARSWPVASLARADVAARVSNDFANGRVVMVEGWMLSQTEARLCALAQLS